MSTSWGSPRVCPIDINRISEASKLSIRRPPIPMHLPSAGALIAILIALFLACGWLLWKQTRFT